MRINSARLTDFRNIESASITFARGLNVFIGPNGHGKTNLLEALYTVAALRPLRSVPRVNLIRRHQDQSQVTLFVSHETTDLTHELSLRLSARQRELARDGKSTPVGAFVGALTAVAFTPDDLALSKGGPEGRRRFMDRAIFNARPAYLDLALTYARALRTRNTLLRQKPDDDLLDAYDQPIANLGAELTVSRARYVAEFSEYVFRIFGRIACPAPDFTLAYRPSAAAGGRLDLSSTADVSALLSERLRDNRPKDRARGTTSVGPHLDDLEINVDGVNARLSASQGQHRAIVLAIKLAEILHLTHLQNEPPILLLDDISSELDQHRSRQLFATISELDAQVMITTTDPRQVPGPFSPESSQSAFFDVSNGVITPSP